ncbi:hypothetical protein BD289DRAFT_444501 [Coniella lustricola]|uniref:Uncharacterized protein n=1 Tax=Coniella lustricola TaxID=2025994 RepID=A0A2T2ZVV4_9PEZI|nr:hypothetical protein BD289DRAFT_444501 [Coniella lustricola]
MRFSPLGHLTRLDRQVDRQARQGRQTILEGKRGSCKEGYRASMSKTTTEGEENPTEYKRRFTVQSCFEEHQGVHSTVVYWRKQRTRHICTDSNFATQCRVRENPTVHSEGLFQDWSIVHSIVHSKSRHSRPCRGRRSQVLLRAQALTRRCCRTLLSRRVGKRKLVGAGVAGGYVDRRLQDGSRMPTLFGPPAP